MESSLRVISLAHQTAPLEIREIFSFSKTQTEAFYTKLRDFFGVDEMLLLSTCNRTELYYYHLTDLSQDIVKLMCGEKSKNSAAFGNFFKIYEGREAINYLFDVAMGLKSQVLGDLEIYAQVKNAYQTSVELGCAGPLLNRLMHSVFYCHKQVNQNTAFKSGASSISYNTVSLVERETQVDKSAKVLVIGAGKMGSDICDHFQKRGFSNVYITNRTDSKAFDLSNELGIGFLPYYRHREDLKEFDVVVSTIATNRVAYEASDFLVSHVKLLIDVSSPRSIDPNVQEVGISLFNVDHLGAIVDDVLSKRKQEVPKVREEINQVVDQFFKWKEEVVYTDQLKKFKATLEELRRQTLCAMMKNMDSDQVALAEQVTNKMVQKIINLPAVQIRSACQRGNAEELSESLAALFDLEAKSNVKPINKTR